MNLKTVNKMDNYSKIILNVDKGVKHLSNWNGMSSIPNGKVLLNKSITGCGATTYYLNNNEDVILCSPRVQLLTCKLEDDNIQKNLYYYDSKIQYRDYLLQEHIDKNVIRKILVTYDSFPVLMDFIVSKYGMDYASSFKIVVDEYQELYNDSHFKAVTEMQFIQCVFRFPNILFITATPILEKYLYAIPEFNQIQWFVKLNFNPDDVEEIIPISKPMKSPKSVFKDILEEWKRTGNFGVIKSLDGSGRQIESREAVFFLNNVGNICKILSSFKTELTGKVNVVCADNESNSRRLRKVGFSIGKVPKKGEPNAPFTFVTRTAFAGVDMYSNNASTYVFADYSIDAMLVDVSLDLRQIAGRQRDVNNQFRQKITVFYKENPNLITQQDFIALQNQKTNTTNQYLQNLVVCNNQASFQAIEDRVERENKEENTSDRKTYLSIIPDGIGGQKAIFNNFIMVAEQRQFEMFQYRNLPVIIASSVNKGSCAVSNPVLEQLRLDLLANSGDYRKRLQLIHDCYLGYNGDKFDVEKYVAYLGYDTEMDFLNKLGPERVRACGYDTFRLRDEIIAMNSQAQISFRVGQMFFPGLVYSKKDVKDMLQQVYNELGIKKVAKSTDLPLYIGCEGAKLDGNKAYRIL